MLMREGKWLFEVRLNNKNINYYLKNNCIMKTKIISICLLFQSYISFSQENMAFYGKEEYKFSGQTNANERQEFHSLTLQFKEYTIYSLDGQALNNYVAGSTQTSFELVLGDIKWKLDIQWNDVRSDDYKMDVLTDHGIVTYTKEDFPANTYAGIVNGNYDSDVRLSIRDHIIVGSVSEKGKDQIFIEPLADMVNGAPENQFVVYKLSSLIVSPEINCFTEDFSLIKNTQSKQANGNPVIASRTCEEVKYAIATDLGYYQQNGSSLTNTSNAINDALNWANGMFANPALNINWKIVKTFIVTTTNPTEWGTSCDVTVFKGGLNMWDYNGGFGAAHDASTLITSRDISHPQAGTALTGISTQGGVCMTAPAASGSYGANYYYKLNIIEHLSGMPAANHYINMTHEDAHNLNAPHEAGTIMDPYLGQGANTWGPNTITAITSFADSKAASAGGCLGICTQATGINTPNNLIAASSIITYPNPASKLEKIHFAISSKPLTTFEIKLYDMLGRTVLSDQIKTDSSGKFIYEVSPGIGMFMFVIENENTKMSEKIVIQ
jgi:hypothetical protein